MHKPKPLLPLAHYGKRHKRKGDLACRLLALTAVLSVCAYLGFALKYARKAGVAADQMTPRRSVTEVDYDTQQATPIHRHATHDTRHPISPANSISPAVSPQASSPTHKSTQDTTTQGTQIQPPADKQLEQRAQQQQKTQSKQATQHAVEQSLAHTLKQTVHAVHASPLQQVTSPTLQAETSSPLLTSPETYHTSPVSQGLSQQQQQRQAAQDVNAPSQPGVPATAPNTPAGLYALTALDIDGMPHKLADYAGNVTLVVNLASACGYTDANYKGLQATYEKYHRHGLTIMGFPCNQFGSQEQGSLPEIKAFAHSRYHITWPLFTKVDVNGPHTHLIYEYLKRNLPVSEGGGGGVGPGEDISWNFWKILVDQRGRPVKRFHMAWDSPAIEREIYRLISAPAAAA